MENISSLDEVNEWVDNYILTKGSSFELLLLFSSSSFAEITFSLYRTRSIYDESIIPRVTGSRAREIEVFINNPSIFLQQLNNWIYHAEAEESRVAVKSCSK